MIEIIKIYENTWEFHINSNILRKFESRKYIVIQAFELKSSPSSGIPENDCWNFVKIMVNFSFPFCFLCLQVRWGSEIVGSAGSCAFRIRRLRERSSRWTNAGEVVAVVVVVSPRLCCGADNVAKELWYAGGRKPFEFWWPPVRGRRLHEHERAQGAAADDQQQYVVVEWFLEWRWKRCDDAENATPCDVKAHFSLRDAPEWRFSTAAGRSGANYIHTVASVSIFVSGIICTYFFPPLPLNAYSLFKLRVPWRHYWKRTIFIQGEAKILKFPYKTDWMLWRQGTLNLNRVYILCLTSERIDVINK